ncbi:MAG: DegV family protein [Clostridia bacterium]|nr:DegV family protein [Clostridia bacterium]
MSNKIKIIADSTCDLPKDIIEKHDITILPLYVVMDEKSYKDGVETTAQDLFDYSDRTKQTPKTSAASVTDFIDTFTPYAEQGYDIIYIGISSGLSSTVQNATIAATEFDTKIFAFDSLNLSTGIGLQVMRACELREQGLSAEEIIEKLEETRPKVRSSFVIDVMTYLHRGGRCTTLQAVGATMLNLKPQIVVEDGKMRSAKKFRGNIIKSAVDYVNDMLANIEVIDDQRIFITHSLSKPELVEAVKAAVEAKGYFKEILVSNASSVISSHCGPNCIGILFIEK